MDKQTDMFSNGEEIHIADYIRVIRKRIGLFMLVYALIALTGGVYTFFIKPVYQAEIKIELLDAPEDDLSALTSFGGLKNDRIETELEKLRSRDIARQVVLNLNLLSNTEALVGHPEISITKVSAPFVTRELCEEFLLVFHDDQGGFTVQDMEGTVLGVSSAAGMYHSDRLVLQLDTIKVEPGDQVILRVNELESTVDRLRDATSVYRVGETSIVGIAVRGGQPKLAKQIADEFHRVYALRNLEEKNASARAVNKFISERKDFYEQKLDDASRELQDFKENHNIFSLESRNSSLINQIAAIETQKAVKSLDRERIDNAIVIVREDRDFSTPEIFAPQSALEQLSARLSMLQVQKKKMLNNLTPDHPSVVDVTVQVEEIKKAILEKLMATRSIIDQEVASLSKQLDEYDEQVKSLPELDKEVVQKIREVKFYEEMVLQMATKSEAFSIKEVSTLSSIRIAQAAIIPADPIKPRVMVNLFLAMIIAGVAGLGAVFLREYFDNTFVSTEEVEEILGNRVLVTIPFLKKRFSNDVVLDRKEGLAFLTVDSPVTESFKTLKTAVEFLDMGATERIIQITSSIAGEGKSTIAANLAISFANAGHKTLLIDADYRKPMAQNLLGVENRIGFVDMMFKGMSVYETIQDTTIDNLSLIASGQASVHTGQGISLSELQPILEKLRKEYDYIFIDTPPVLAVDDSIRIGRVVDRLVLIVALGHVDRVAARRCQDRCQQNGIEISGIVVNDCNQTEKYSRGFQYYQYYTYANDNQPKGTPHTERKWRIYINK